MAAAPRDWSDPCLEQAREDLKAVNALVATAPDCGSTVCMLLQMVYEKLAKATITRNGMANPRNHQVATRLFLLLDRHPALPPALQVPRSVRQFVDELENATPQIANLSDRSGGPPWPRLEYPWEDAAGNVLYPARDLPLARRVKDPKDRILLDCLKFATNLAINLPALYP